MPPYLRGFSLGVRASFGRNVRGALAAQRLRLSGVPCSLVSGRF